MNLFTRNRGGSRQAVAWFARLRSGRWNVSADKAWKRWMANSPRNVESYENLELAWELAEELRDRPLMAGMLRDADSILKDDVAVTRKIRRFGLKPAWGAGGVLAAVMVAGLAIGVYISNKPSLAEYATVVGEQRTVILTDHSTISLNTATHVLVSYSRGLRRVELLSGEAVFSVIHDSARSFEVHAVHGTTMAIGTEFDVQILGGTTAVSVLKGTVKVRSTEKRDDGPSTELSAGQAADYSADGVLTAIRSADANKVRGWLAQRIVFSNVALSEALADYNRYIKLPIVLGSPHLASRRINGVFRVGDQASFLNALEQGLHVSATTTESGTVLNPQ